MISAVGWTIHSFGNSFQLLQPLSCCEINSPSPNPQTRALTNSNPNTPTREEITTTNNIYTTIQLYKATTNNQEPTRNKKTQEQSNNPRKQQQTTKKKQQNNNQESNQAHKTPGCSKHIIGDMPTFTMVGKVTVQNLSRKKTG